MDARTREFIETNMTPRSVDEMINAINVVYDKIKIYEGAEITNELVKTIFSEIDKEFYKNRFAHFISICNPEKPKIEYKENTNPCPRIDAILEATIYEEGDHEFETYLFSFITATRCLSGLRVGTVYYSGGYKTTNKLKFIILMLLHESLHILEYNDSILTVPVHGVEHNLFFYFMAYKYFRMISRLSQYFTAAKASKEIKYTIDERELAIQQIVRNVENGRIKDVTADGQDTLNDHSHAGRLLLGYLTHPQFEDVLLGGNRSRKIRRRHRITRRKTR
jgi:hypothetical protein